MYSILFAQQGNGGNGGNGGGEATPDASSDKVEWATQMAIEYGIPVAKALVFLIVAWIVAGWVAGLVRKGMNKAGIDETLTKFIGKLAAWGVKIIAVIAALGLFGFETTSLAALLGGAGLAVGLAFQGTLGSFAAGVMLLIFRPFKVGDVVSVGGVTAKVFEIGIFSTLLDSPDNRRFIVPNGAIFGSTIENITFHSQRRVQVDVGVDYTADIDRTREVLTSALEGLEGALADPAPAVVLTGLGASSVDWCVRAWCATGDFFPVQERLTRAVKIKLDEAGIGIPYPQMDVHLDHRPADG